MKALIQRVSSASVHVGGEEIARIGRGVLVLLGVGREDTEQDAGYVAGKIRDLRLFDDDDGKMNRSLIEINGEALVVSQFTLYGDCRRGRRPSFSQAAPPERARQLYEQVVASLRDGGVPVRTGVFQAMMQVALVNDGPVTIAVDSAQ